LVDVIRQLRKTARAVAIRAPSISYCESFAIANSLRFCRAACHGPPLSPIAEKSLHRKAGFVRLMGGLHGRRSRGCRTDNSGGRHMHKLIVVGFAAAAVALSAYGPSQSTGRPVTTPAPSDSVATQQIAALAEQVFPKVGEQGAYAVCGADGNVSACPFTDRLKARLTELRQTLLRAQNLSTTREITAEMMSPVVGIAHVTLFQGRTKLDLWIVQRDERLLVDDEMCAGRKDTSIYAPFVTCEAAT